MLSGGDEFNITGIQKMVYRHVSDKVVDVDGKKVRA